MEKRRKDKKKEQGSEKWKKKKKRSEAQRAKPCTPTPAIDTLIEDEEEMGKEKREQRNKHFSIATQSIHMGILSEWEGKKFRSVKVQIFGMCFE